MRVNLRTGLFRATLACYMCCKYVETSVCSRLDNKLMKIYRPIFQIEEGNLGFFTFLFLIEQDNSHSLKNLNREKE